MNLTLESFLGIYFATGLLNLFYTGLIKKVESDDWETPVFVWFMFWWVTWIGRAVAIIQDLYKKGKL